ncbi:PilN domain-containing protein, partial [Chloroflexota bacterium]
TIKFYNSSQPEKPLDPDIPILVSGELAEEPETCESIANKLNHPVSPLQSPLEYPEDFTPSQYMANIGLALKELSVPRKEANFLRLNLNTLPDTQKPKPISLIKFLIIPAIIILAASSLIPLVTLVRDTLTETSLMQSELESISQLIERRLEQRKAITELEEKVNEVEASRDSFAAVIDYIDTERYLVNGNLDVTMAALLQVIDLSTITNVSDELTISGTAPSEIEVLTYAKKLRESGIFAQVTISSMEKIEKEDEEGMEFTFTLSQ